MIKFTGRRALLQAASLLLISATLYGCGRDGKVVSGSGEDTGREQKNQAMGRYVESEIPLPEGITFDSVISFQDGPDGKPLLFTRRDINGVTEFTGYLLSEDMSWEEKECGWLNRLELSYEYGRADISYGEDKRLYAVYSDEDDEEVTVRHRLIVTEDWENGWEIEMPLLEEKNELGYTYYPDRITALENGNLLVDSGQGRLFLYDASGQQKIAETIGDGSHFTVGHNQFYVIDEASRSLILYEGDKGTEKAKYPLELNSFYEARVIAGENGDVSLISNEGIQILKNGSDIWEQIVEGDRNTMGSPQFYPTGFARGKEDDYFVYYDSMDETGKLVRYVYQPDMPSEPETVLTVFGLYDNQTIRQAVSVYQIENPNVRVEFEPLMEEGDGAVPDDYIRTLNTELLAGKGPDILILDGLSETSYIEKGVLEDITDVVESLVSSGDFLPNIADGSRVDGRIYSVPVKIGLPMTFGRKGALQEAGRLDTLANLVQTHENGQIFGTVDRNAFLSLYADAFLSDAVGEDGVIKEQELRNFLLCMKEIFDGSRISDGTRDNRPTSIWGLLEKGTFLHSEETAGFFESSQGTSIMEQAVGELMADMTVLNKTYLPYGTIGINNAGENKEKAIDFLRTALSEKVQRSDFYDGFSVNGNALEFLCGIERNSADAYGGPIDGVDGRTYEFKTSWPSEPLRRRLAEFLRSVEHSAGRNGKLKEILLTYSGNYFDGAETLDQAVEELMGKMTLYLQE